MGAGAKGGVSQTARDLGMPRDKVRRSLAIAGLAPETKAKAADLGLASNKAALLEAAKAAGSAAVTFSPSASRRSTSSRIVSSVLGAARAKRALLESSNHGSDFPIGSRSKTLMKFSA